jgi:hypothetical protein
MSDTKRTVFISLGTSLLVVILVPLVVCLSMMLGMNNMMTGDGDMMSRMTGAAWIPIDLVLLLLVAGVVLLISGVRQPR